MEGYWYYYYRYQVNGIVRYLFGLFSLFSGRAHMNGRDATLDTGLTRFLEYPL